MGYKADESVNRTQGRKISLQIELKYGRTAMTNKFGTKTNFMSRLNLGGKRWMAR